MEAYAGKQFVGIEGLDPQRVSQVHVGTTGLQRVHRPVPAVGGLQHHLRAVAGPSHHRRQPLHVIDDPHRLQHLTSFGGPNNHRPASMQMGAVLVAEIGDVTRFASASKLTCWAGLTPKHHESDTHVRRGRITKQGSRLVRWAAIDSVKTVSKTSEVGVLRERVADRRGRNIGSVAAARLQLEFVFYALRDGHVRALEHLPAVA
jgi:Transposase IS116/IS110/IS902 family